jgi:hypothetical protein
MEPKAKHEKSRRPTHPVGVDERLVLEALARAGTLDAEGLTAVVGLPAERVGAALVSLEIKGRIRPFSAGFFRIQAEGASSS